MKTDPKSKSQERRQAAQTDTVEAQAVIGSVRVATDQERAAWEGQQNAAHLPVQGLGAVPSAGGLVERVEPAEAIGVSPATDRDWAEEIAKRMLTPEEQEGPPCMSPVPAACGMPAPDHWKLGLVVGGIWYCSASCMSRKRGPTTGRDCTYQHKFVQFSGQIVVHDVRSIEQLTDRAAVGKPLGDHGPLVLAIVLDGGWFEVTVAPVAPGEDMRTYRVPVSNVRSARR